MSETGKQPKVNMTRERLLGLLDQQEDKPITALDRALEDCRLIQAEWQKREYISIREFQKYAVLYRKSTAEEIIEDESRSGKYVALSQEFMVRINPHKPIRLTDDDGNVVGILPAIYTEYDPMQGKNAERVLGRVYKYLDPNNMAVSPSYHATDTIEMLFTACDVAQDRERVKTEVGENDAILASLRELIPGIKTKEELMNEILRGPEEVEESEVPEEEQEVPMENDDAASIAWE